MLILSRKVGEQIVIGNGITVTVRRISGDRISLAFQAPGDVRIMRGELLAADTAAPSLLHPPRVSRATMAADSADVQEIVLTAHAR